jgi:hypothetical protein
MLGQGGDVNRRGGAGSGGGHGFGWLNCHGPNLI